MELSGALPALPALADPADLAGSSPLAALLDSLKTHAGSVVERLAAIELQAARQGGTLTVVGGRTALRLPRTGGGGGGGG